MITLKTSQPDSIGIISTGQDDNYTTGCLLDYNYFKTQYKIIIIDLSKQPVLNVDPKSIHQINFTGNFNFDGNLEHEATIFFIIEEARETVLDFSKGTVKAF